MNEKTKNKELAICTNCVHCDTSKKNYYGVSGYRCIHPAAQKIDRVTGKESYYLCESMRIHGCDEYGCGLDNTLQFRDREKFSVCTECDQVVRRDCMDDENICLDCRHKDTESKMQVAEVYSETERESNELG